LLSFIAPVDRDVRFDPLTGIGREKNIHLSKRGGKQLLGLEGMASPVR
jgi:hypothetical protein